MEHSPSYRNMTDFSGWPCRSQYAFISFLNGAFFLCVQ